MSQILDNVTSLSKRLQVAPLKEGEVALFKLIRAGRKVDFREEPLTPEVAQYPGVEQVYDPFEKENGERTKTIGTRIIDYRTTKNGQAIPNYEPIIFIKGEKRVPFSDHAVYEFMMRSKHCASNRFRKQMGGKGTAIWELVNGDRVKEGLALNDLKFYAESMLRKCDAIALKTIAMKLNSSPDPRLHIASYKPGLPEDIQQIKLDLFNKSKDFPKQVLYASDDATSKKRVEAHDALTLAVMYVNERGGYNLVTEDKDDEIFTPEIGKDSFESLIAFFENEKGAAAYLRFASALQRARKIPA